ncbi:SGNH/GDSL hydrolase family protein [Salinibacterium sp. G-O1]|uniref:SGNH/GDSL hydrolase family protein n=1 Tax=Salinibacterium sp. G-O1 TaxID=3046208 RepID=UPI0024BB0D89|nr:SGNH/GDSL hydrolase family protein [Salinibacterium sp. G-O1]MDJ0335345.1 SGNH/GDSL hydrolase family protein [Salinibacterium sp. G-O1]
MIGVVLAVILAGCAAPSAPTAESATPSATSSQRTVLAIGDSIPFNAEGDCPGCAGFVDTYADELAQSNDEPYLVVNRSRHDGAQTADILRELQSGSLDAALGDAVVVIVSAGFNDQPPYADEGEACRAEQLVTDAEVLAAVIATSTECITTQTASTGAELAGVLDHVREKAPEASILVLTAYNAWSGWSVLEAEQPDVRASVNSTIASGLIAWRAEVCKVVAVVDAQCVDLLEPFNGPEGTTAAGSLLADDYTHPSQEGNDLIRDVLLDADLR